MNDVEYNLQFEKLCKILNLGEVLGATEAISGGLLHRMYAVETTRGKYAVKALNPRIMLRPTAMQNYIYSEQIAFIAANSIPALPARRFNGTFMQEIDKQFYLVFDWVEGKTLKPNEINTAHCEKVGAILAGIHMMDFSGLGIIKKHSDKLQLTDWNFYLQKGQENNAVWVNLLIETIDKIYEWNTQANESEKFFASDMVISHRDLDPKNVMWNQDNPIIIDWESAGYTNPMQELVEAAVYWSENEVGSIDMERFLAFMSRYKKRRGNLQADWRKVLVNGFSGKLGWLEYNLKRSLWMDCTDEIEQQLGTSQVTETINSIIRYADMVPKIEDWIKYEV
jgi:Ser/Thr protein kinase RdoA (MazF antagonist)